MDAYYDYVKTVTEARLAELRREADEHRLARSLAANANRTGRSRFGIGARLRARAARRASGRPMARPVRLPRPMPATDEHLRRTA
ncbi:MAG: hypothetical protein ACRD2W_08125 [Acidimicrobiales bacterium]